MKKQKGSGARSRRAPARAVSAHLAGSGTSDHAHRDSVLKRLARIEGHVRGVKRLVEADVPCPEVLVQIAAVRSALGKVGQIILEDHLQGCMVNALRNGSYDESMRELKQSLDRFFA